MPNTVDLHDWSNSNAEQDSYPVRLGRGIAAMRELRQLSRKELASRLRVSANRLGYWERGVNRPPGDKTIELLRVLEVTPDELLEAGEVKTSTPSPDMDVRGHFERRRTMSNEMEQEPVVVVEPDLKSERVQEESVAPDPLVTGEDPDLKSERVQDE
ncbi:MAG TPA: helix-turn-helix transcriptional regulator [Thermoanaerobaculia bacterium]|nr:helix-turn-helix transcriptional regulator [Thermoanaerobaculia bacterium]